MDKGDDPYKILGVTSTASADDIKKSYRKMALKHHPDRATGDHALFSRISNAYEILSDDEQRRNYDLQQQYGNNVGFDPNGPTYSSASAPRSSNTTTTNTNDYSGGKPQKQRTTKTYTSSSEPQEWTYTSEPQEWTSTSSSSPQEEEWTYSTPQSTTYSTTTTKSKPTKKRTGTKTTSHHSGKSFHDPFEIFKQQFGEDYANQLLGKQQPSSSNKKKDKTACSGNGEADDDPHGVMGMSSSTRTVTHPNGQKEVITETVITRFDGSTETSSSSKMGNNGGSGSSTMMSPTKKKGTKIKSGKGSPKKSTFTTTTSSSSPSPMFTTTTTMKNMSLK
jgi:curved DNA-binding protein CbpA